MKPRNQGLGFNGERAAKVERTESAFQKERARIRAANDEKTARLRGLRLAKEAADRETATRVAAEKALLPPKGKAAKAAAPASEP